MTHGRRCSLWAKLSSPVARKAQLVHLFSTVVISATCPSQTRYPELVVSDPAHTAPCAAACTCVLEVQPHSLAVSATFCLMYDFKIDPQGTLLLLRVPSINTVPFQVAGAFQRYSVAVTGRVTPAASLVKLVLCVRHPSVLPAHSPGTFLRCFCVCADWSMKRMFHLL